MELYILEAKGFFTEKQWIELTEGEQLKCGQVVYIYYACIHLGITVQCPDFMLKKEVTRNNVENDYATKQNIKVVYACNNCHNLFVLKEHRDQHAENCNSKNKTTFNRIIKTKETEIKKYRDIRPKGNISIINPVENIKPTTKRKRNRNKNAPSTKTKENIKNHACDQCSFVTSSIIYLKIHASKHEDKASVCPICNKTFASRQSLGKHKKNIHTNIEKKFKCELCPYRTHVRRNLKMHMKVHADVKEFVCEMCGKQFNQKGNLKMHYLKHAEDRRHKCTYCEKGFYTNTDLVKHTNAIHLKLKSFKCNVCEYATAIKGALNRHMLRHSDEFAFKCRFCKYKCCTSVELETHVESIHRRKHRK